jgi:hypothetical protein
MQKIGEKGAEAPQSRTIVINVDAFENGGRLKHGYSFKNDDNNYNNNHTNKFNNNDNDNDIYIYSQAQLEHFLKNLQYLREAHKNLSDCGKDTAVL